LSEVHVSSLAETDRQVDDDVQEARGAVGQKDVGFFFLAASLHDDAQGIL
jgi:hypothetical protein